MMWLLDKGSFIDDLVQYIVMKKTLLTLAFVGVTTTIVHAQQQTVRGLVVAAEDGQPVIGATVVVKGQTSIGVATNVDGQFTLNVPKTATKLIVSYVGYKAQEVEIKPNLKITLQSEAKTLDDLVVVGYGSARKNASVVSSVVTVKAKDLEAKPAPNPLEALQGKVSGLQAFTNSGEPSEMGSMRIRGNSTLSNISGASEPLFILDGAPVSQATIRGLNANDIATLQILKDAAATSIYGARAANGVVYITTKRGTAGDHANVTVRGQYGISNLANREYFDSMMDRDQLSKYLVEIGTTTQANMDKVLATYPGVDTNWADYIYQKDRPSYQTDIAVSGGAGRTQYYFSAALQDQKGLRHGSEYRKNSFRLNLNTEINKYISVGTNNSLSIDKFRVNPYSANAVAGGLAMLIQPWLSPYDADGNELPQITGTTRYTAGYLTSKDIRKQGYTTLNSNSFLQVKPIQGLTFRSQFGYEIRNYEYDRLRLPSFLGALNNGLRTLESGKIITQNWTNTLEYKFTLKDKHNFIALAGQEFTDYDYNSFSGTGQGLTNDRLTAIDQTTTEKNFSGDTQQYAFFSLFGRLSYDYDGRYFADLTVRNDASSRFGENNRSATFWSLGLMWVAKKEAFLENVKWLNDLRVKFSLGTQGNAQIGNYNAYALAGAVSQYNSVLGRGITAAGNPNLSWEKQSSLSLGFEGRMFNRLNVNLEFYRRVTSDMLMSVPFPYYTGFIDSNGRNDIIQNVGEYENKGIDLSVNYDLIKASNGDGLSLYANINYNTDKILSLFQGLNYWANSSYSTGYVVGQPVMYFSPIWAGVNSATGEPQWYVPGSDPAVTTKGTITSDFSEALEQNTGIRRYAPWNGGFGLNGKYKGFSLDAEFTFSLGKYMQSNDNYFFENPTVFPGFNQRETVMDYWKQPGDVTAFPSLKYDFTQFDSRMISNASFARLKTLTLGYTFSQSLLKGQKILKGAKVYVTGRNLLTFTKFQGVDPELDTNNTLGANPNTKQIVFGVELNF